MGSIKVKLSGFREGAADICRMKEQFAPTVKRELKTFGDESIQWLQKQIRISAFPLPPKKHDNHRPVLIDTENYIRSYQAFVEDKPLLLGLVSVGMNKNMLNEDLAELLEWGWKHRPPSPHLRPLAVYMESQAGVLGDRISKALFR